MENARDTTNPFVNFLKHDRRMRTDHPTWEDIERAIKALNGSTSTLLMLCENDTRLAKHLCICGGHQGKYAVYIAGANGELHNLINTHGTDENIVVNCDGQGTDYHDWQLVNMDWVLLVSRRFYFDGTAETAFDWVGNSELSRLLIEGIGAFLPGEF